MTLWDDTLSPEYLLTKTRATIHASCASHVAAAEQQFAASIFQYFEHGKTKSRLPGYIEFLLIGSE